MARRVNWCRNGLMKCWLGNRGCSGFKPAYFFLTGGWGRVNTSSVSLEALASSV